MFWNTKQDLVCSKMINHGINQVTSQVFFGKNPFLIDFKNPPFLSAQIAILRSSFSVFIVLGIYNFGSNQLHQARLPQSPISLNDANMRTQGLQYIPQNPTKQCKKQHFDNRPFNLHLDLQRVLALCKFHQCEFHYCGFSKLLLKFG